MLKDNFGKIMNVASIASFVPGQLNSIYCASKAFVLSFSEADAGTDLIILIRSTQFDIFRIIK